MQRGLCVYIINNFMAKLKLPNNNALQLDSGSEGDQSEDEDPSVNNSLDPQRINSIPEGEPSAIEHGSSNIDKDMTEPHHSKMNQDDATLILSLLDTS